METAQELVNKYSKTGTLKFCDSGKWTNKEFIELENNIGVVVDEKTKEETLTNYFSIHYSKKGTHIVPRKRRDKK